MYMYKDWYLLIIHYIFVWEETFPSTKNALTGHQLDLNMSVCLLN